MKKKILKYFGWFLAFVTTLILVTVVAFQVSPRPGVILFGRAFNGPVVITDQKTFDVASSSVVVLEDQKYPSAEKRNTYDLYLPKDISAPVPVIIWAHGGGFIGGDKSGLKEFATKLVADAHVAIVSMNYEVAPDAHYPSQVRQVDELVKELQEKKIQNIDLNRLFFGGDSAGSQIALQYVALQTNPVYAKEMQFENRIKKEALKGVLSYCGPVDLQQLADSHSDSFMMKFFVKTVAWSLIGTKNWKDDSKLAQASIVNHVTPDFPPTYVTDGNAFSFEQQGIALVERLNALNVPTKGLFYKDSPKDIPHEYQFNFATDEAKVSYQQTLDFINQYQ